MCSLLGYPGYGSVRCIQHDTHFRLLVEQPGRQLLELRCSGGLVANLLPPCLLKSYFRRAWGVWCHVCSISLRVMTWSRGDVGGTRAWGQCPMARVCKQMSAKQLSMKRICVYFSVQLYNAGKALPAAGDTNRKVLFWTDLVSMQLQVEN